MRGSVRNLWHFRLAERQPALAYAVMAPLICWSFSNSMFRYLLVDRNRPLKTAEMIACVCTPGASLAGIPSRQG